MITHSHSKHRSTSTDGKSRDRIRRRHRDIDLRRGKSRDKYGRHRSTSTDGRSRDRIRRRHRTRSQRHDYSSRPKDHRLERRNRCGSGERHHQSSIQWYDRSCPLLPYKHFFNSLAVNILPDEANGRYKPYLRLLKQAFFAAHKDDHRLKQLYHPSYIQIAIHKRNENAKAVAKNFFEDLRNGALVCLTNYDYAPTNPLQHLKDLYQARSLIAKIDAEKGIEDNLLLSSRQDGEFAQFIPVNKPDESITVLGGIELMNVVITYLWLVHGIDYCGMAELDKDLIFGEENQSVAEWEHRLDSAWQARMQATDPLHVFLGNDKIECLVNRNLCAHFGVVEKEKGDGNITIRYVKSCGKRCKALGDIITHIHDEHCEIVKGYDVKAKEEIYLENYMNDPCAPCIVTGR